MENILPVQNTNNIRLADFVRVTTKNDTYLFSTAPYDITVPEVDAEPFTGLSQLISIGDVPRDIKSTAAETVATFIGIQTSMLSLVLNEGIKGSKLEMWHGFFDTEDVLITTGGTGGLYKFFTGYINSFNITEQWMEAIRSYTGVITVSASSIQIILQNRTSGRYTNNNAWQFFNPNDTSMNRVPFIETINYPFGKDAPSNS